MPKSKKTELKRKWQIQFLSKIIQFGTVTETLETINLAYQNKYNCFVSHRSGETEDTTISDLTVSVGTGHLKPEVAAGVNE